MQPGNCQIHMNRLPRQLPGHGYPQVGFGKPFAQTNVL